MKTIKALFDLVLAVIPLFITLAAFMHYNDTAYFGKALAMVGLIVLLDIRIDVRKLRQAAEKKAAPIVTTYNFTGKP